MKTTDLFLDFLSRLGVADSFLSNYYKGGTSRSLLEFFKSVKPDRYICAAFLWGASSQDYDFWRTVHAAWLDTLSRWQEQTGKAGGHRRK